MRLRVFIIAILAALAHVARCLPLMPRNGNVSIAASQPVSYHPYLGDGTIDHGWPSTSQWVDFDAMWSNNQRLLHSSCTQHKQPNNSDREINDIRAAILSEAASSDVDSRFILATILQESGGCVRAPTTSIGVTNPGLMQTHNGKGTCHNTIPCLSSMITTMITDGVVGTYGTADPIGEGGEGPGLQQCLSRAAAAGASDAAVFYHAARIYNTGSYKRGTDLGNPICGTACYASDIANRLVGWDGVESKCTLKNPQK